MGTPGWVRKWFEPATQEAVRRMLVRKGVYLTALDARLQSPHLAIHSYVYWSAGTDAQDHKVRFCMSKFAVENQHERSFGYLVWKETRIGRKLRWSQWSMYSDKVVAQAIAKALAADFRMSVIDRRLGY